MILSRRKRTKIIARQATFSFYPLKRVPIAPILKSEAMRVYPNFIPLIVAKKVHVNCSDLRKEELCFSSDIIR